MKTKERLAEGLSTMSMTLKKVRALFGRKRELCGMEFFFREVAARLHERLDVMRIHPQSVLDAGCGEGRDAKTLAGRYPDAHVVAMDAAGAQLARQGTVETGYGLLCGDFSCPPFAAQTFDLIWSNLAVHWHPDLLRVFGQWADLLRPDGLMLFSCFGEKTLFNLRHFMKSLDGCEHILAFRSIQEIGDMLLMAGFGAPVVEREEIVLTYGEPEKVLADIRALGGNPLNGRLRGLWARKYHRQLLDYLERQKTPEGIISMPFEIIYGHAFREERVEDTGQVVRFYP